MRLMGESLTDSAGGVNRGTPYLSVHSDVPAGVLSKRGDKKKAGLP